MRPYNTERIIQLSQPRQVNKRQTIDSKLSIDHNIDFEVPSTLRRIDEHSKSLTKLKYKEQFLQAIKDSQGITEDVEVSKKKHKK